MDMISAEEIKALMANFAECKAEYAESGGGVDTGELFHYACQLQHISILLQTLLNQVGEAFERIENERYPETVFLPITDEDLDSLKNWCNTRGFPIDRLSAYYGRLLRKADREIAANTLAAIQPYLTTGDTNE